MGPIPDFAEAEEQFRRFLHEHGTVRPIVWVFREQVTFVDSQLWVNLDRVHDGRRLAESYYTRHRDRPGIELNVLCRIGDRTCCYLYAPADTREAEELMISGLKLSCPLHVPEARTVGSRWRWWLLRWRGRRGHAALGLHLAPSRW